jgi:hypothetical protein
MNEISQFVKLVFCFQAFSFLTPWVLSLGSSAFKNLVNAKTMTVGGPEGG